MPLYKRPSYIFQSIVVIITIISLDVHLNKYNFSCCVK
ncbi:hypothetical protein A1OE_1347 [Candidatus Endolissoclinum faulkneri L2]|uniref:Uncharacterized protein n=1 Tax=Candidatus Endolissoclinum faulkneri L2 TaxID=1193729 RepID=K7YIT4_9PROT|nr:hypothetical protein A1OE_1347 [Candidatus Endolissoclinum faulkneri L2]